MGMGIRYAATRESMIRGPELGRDWKGPAASPVVKMFGTSARCGLCWTAWAYYCSQSRTTGLQGPTRPKAVEQERRNADAVWAWAWAFGRITQCGMKNGSRQRQEDPVSHFESTAVELQWW